MEDWLCQISSLLKYRQNKQYNHSGVYLFGHSKTSFKINYTMTSHLMQKKNWEFNSSVLHSKALSYIQKLCLTFNFFVLHSKALVLHLHSKAQSNIQKLSLTFKSSVLHSGTYNCSAESRLSSELFQHIVLNGLDYLTFLYW